ncbi:MAG: peptide chain release factor N(5)-glutamine methyltransferase [bacterium]|nr:peptide chain release factor N(5)-glutamine methyltransferase [bacterium]
MESLKDALKSARRLFKEAHIQTASLDARVLLSFAAGKPIEWIFAHGEEALPEQHKKKFEALIRRRVSGEPVARLMGEKEFWGLMFQLAPETLVPRPDSETLIESVLDLLPNLEKKYRFLDLGTGSGCLLAALLSEYPKAEGIGVDLSPDAAQQAQKNWQGLGLKSRSQALVGQWCDPLEFNSTFDLIISNPPYIPDEEVTRLDVEVKDYDPALALKGGGDGLDCYRALAQEAKPFLKPSGYLILEIGAGQAEDVTNLFAAQRWQLVTQRSDLGGHVRALSFR